MDPAESLPQAFPDRLPVKKNGIFFMLRVWKYSLPNTQRTI